MSTHSKWNPKPEVLLHSCLYCQVISIYWQTGAWLINKRPQFCSQVLPIIKIRKVKFNVRYLGTFLIGSILSPFPLNLSFIPYLSDRCIGKFCRRWDSNRGYQVSEATARPTAPQQWWPLRNLSGYHNLSLKKSSAGIRPCWLAQRIFGALIKLVFLKKS